MDIIKCKLFMIPKLTKKHCYFLLFLIGSALREIIPDLVKKYNKKDLKMVNNVSNLSNLKFLFTQKYHEIIRNIISDILIGVFHCMNKIKNKNESKKTNIRNSQKMYYLFNDEANKSRKKYLIIFIISFVDIICQLLFPIKFLIEYFLMNNINDIPSFHLYCLLFIDIFARYLFSRIILKTYFYLHHYLSIFLNIIGLILIAIVDIYARKIGYEFPSFNYLDVSIICIQLILYSFEDIMNKVAFRTLYMLPNTLIFYKGLTQLIYLTIMSILLFATQFYDFENFDYHYEIQYFLAFVPFNILRTIYLVKVIDKFSAQHMTFLKIFETLIIYSYYFFAKGILRDNIFPLNEKWEYYIQGFGFILLLLSSLIHNEIIIINHPKLKGKTKYYLDKDADNEQYSSCYSETLFSESKDSSNSVTNLYSDLTGSDSS